MLKGSKSKKRKAIAWTKEQEQVSENCKNSLQRATELAHPDPGAELVLTTDASDVAMGAVARTAYTTGTTTAGIFKQKVKPGTEKIQSVR